VTLLTQGGDATGLNTPVVRSVRSVSSVTGMVLSSVPRHSTTPAGGASLRMTASDLNTVHIRPATEQRRRGNLPKFRLEPLNGRIAPNADMPSLDAPSLNQTLARSIAIDQAMVAAASL
jgi:hypothetical protein